MTETTDLEKDEPRVPQPSGLEDDDDDPEAGERCFWCAGGVLLPRFTNKTDRICEICDRVDIFKFFLHLAEKYNPDNHEKLELDWVDKLAANSKCPLCRLVVHCLRETYGEAPTDTFWQDGQINGQRVKCSIQRFLPESHDWKGPAAFGCLLVTTEPPLEDLVDRKPKLLNKTRLRHPIAVLLSEGCLESRHRYGGVKRRRLWPDVNAKLAQLWIESCQKAHPFKRPHEFLPDFMRVIDIKKGCLIDSPSAGCEYVTLSYVWGGPQKFSLGTSTKHEFRQSGTLSPTNPNIPWTIRDFLTIVAGIGQRYAWVDSLCVIQDDPIDVQLNVQAMDIIYENAVVTIVAASGTSANDGLPGVRLGTRRLMQGREVIHRLSIGVPLPPLDEAITSSTWNLRGWTYQESILSKRMLVFTDTQMHYRCMNGCTACEETWGDAYEDTKSKQIATQSGLHSYQPKMLAKTAATDAYHGVNNNLGWWVHHVDEICRRKTTLPKDRLHALDGVL
jgi:Heterokaryon incompatibility protein (HET)